MDKDTSAPIYDAAKLAQEPDATMRSTDSNYISNSLANQPKQSEKIVAYVDFSEFNKNYQEYLKTLGVKTPVADETGSLPMECLNLK